MTTASAPAQGTPPADATPPATPPQAPPATPPATPPAAPAPAAPSITGQAATTPPATPTGQPAGTTPPAPVTPPATYEIKVPEGGRVLARDVTRLEAMARKNNWSNEDAQAAVQEFDTLIKAESEELHAETMADSEYGGAKFAQSQVAINRVINSVRPPGHPRRDSFLAKVNRAIGNDIDFVSFLTDIGKKMAEDRPGAGGGGGPTQPRGPEDVLYDKPASKP